MTRSWAPPILGTLMAIGITTGMDANGLAEFSALPLLPLAGLFWYLQRFSRQEVGLAWGGLRYHGIALAHPLLVLGSVMVIVFSAGVVDLSDANWRNAALNIFIGTPVGVLAVLLTEEGFFRGWLWASLRRAGLSDNQVLVWSSVLFALWHVSAVTLETGFDLPASQIPVYLVNATVIAAIWAKMRLVSGSALVPSVCHSVWNGLAYTLFGFGTKTGSLGVTQTAVYGPEVGFLGLALNLLFAAILWRWLKRQKPGTA